MVKRHVKTDSPNDLTLSRLIESEEFAFEFLSTLAERESWRKEIYRPVYHVHKWWAKRLGSVFRGILLGCLLPEGGNLSKAFYERHDFSRVVVFDPFMGSGTTIGEAHKLGCVALGRDINPVACESVRVALGPMDRDALKNAFEQLSVTVGERIRKLYRSVDEQGQECDVLYYFWVKQVPCPQCRELVDLFTTRAFAKNARPTRKPEVHICCPECGEVFSGRNSDTKVRCPSCHMAFNPHEGTASGAKARCLGCAREFAIVEAVRGTSAPPVHRLYAKLLLYPNGAKRYLRTSLEDEQHYRECQALIKPELKRGTIRLPVAKLTDGYNTRQAIGYNYLHWKDFFNARQFLALGWLQDAISKVADPTSRNVLFTLFSGVLEFNNLFASYKGEGTGAVRHMFSHHILKPERMPIEANVWGTPKSSGSFRNLFSGRILRAIEYRDAPFEVAINDKGKVFSVSEPFAGRVAEVWPTAGETSPRSVHLSCGSSDETRLPDQSVDLIVTDPPFFDNVHYSELADFFYAWQSLYPRGFIEAHATTRHAREVQDTQADRFAEKLQRVFLECRRVLKDHGLLAFTYHHSRTEGWTALAEAVHGAGFSVVNAHPVKSEMSVATPKSQAKEPIQLDVIFVCRKRHEDRREPSKPPEILNHVGVTAGAKLARLQALGLSLSRNDCRVAVFSQFLALLGPADSSSVIAQAIMAFRERLDQIALSVFREMAERSSAIAKRRTGEQLTLFSLPE